MRWFTDADRQKMRDAREFSRVRSEIELAEARHQPLADARPMTEAQIRLAGSLSIDPARRRRE